MLDIIFRSTQGVTREQLRVACGRREEKENDAIWNDTAESSPSFNQVCIAYIQIRCANIPLIYKIFIFYQFFCARNGDSFRNLLLASYSFFLPEITKFIFC